MPADNSRHIVAAAKQRSAESRHRAEMAINRLVDGGEATSVAAVCREAHVSRSWLYTQPDLLQRVRQHHQRPAGLPVPPVERASEESTRRRLEIALERNRELSEQVRSLQTQLARAHGARRAEDASVIPINRPRGHGGHLQ